MRSSFENVHHLHHLSFTHHMPTSHYFEATYSCSCSRVWQLQSVNSHTLSEARGATVKPKYDCPQLGNLSISCLSAQQTEYWYNYVSERMSTFIWTIIVCAKCSDKNLIRFSVGVQTACILTIEAKCVRRPGSNNSRYES